MLPSERLQEYGWAKGTTQEFDGHRCVLGSLVEDPHAQRYFDDETRSSLAVIFKEARVEYGSARMKALLARAREQLPHSLPEDESPQAVLYFWNDHPHTTKEAVIATLQEVGL